MATCPDYGKTNSLDIQAKNHLKILFPRYETSVSLFRVNRELYLPYGQKFLFSSNIYTVRKYHNLPAFASALEFNKRRSITDFGVIGVITWPIIQQNNWGINVNGKVSGSQQYAGPAHQRNRWNFEHHIGWDANYHVTEMLRASLGLYHYRIINDFQSDNPARSYINSNGGFASLRYRF